MRTKWIWLVSMAAMAALIVFGAAVACSSSEGTKCSSDDECEASEYCGNDGVCHDRVVPDGGTDGGIDGEDGGGGTDEGPPPCARDIDCPADEVCQDAVCVAGEKTCQFDYNCDSATEFCDPEGGICKSRSALCEPCNRDLECPDPVQNDRCIVYPDGIKYCGQACGVRGCPAGYLCDRTTAYGEGPNPYQCRSNTDSCEGTFICSSDDDCASNKVCNLTTGTCVTKCISDTNCAAGKKCHYTGHCGDPCSSDGDCTTYGSDLMCCLSSVQEWCDDNSTGRCRPDGCVLHSECLLDPPVANSYGYCDQRTHDCMTGCRTANNGVVEDCTSGYRCSCSGGEISCDEMDCCNDPGSGGCLCDPEFEDCSQVSVCDNGFCEKIPCYERGDVAIACARNQVCCGWPTEDGYPCPEQSEEGECYTAVEPVCASCAADAHEECDFTAEGYGYGEKGVCLEDMDGNNYCHLGCRDSQDCPATWQCRFTWVQACDAENPCEATATCDWIYRGYNDNNEVEEVEGCQCTSDADCPTDFNGFVSHCDPMQICDYTIEPPECHEGMVCKAAKACQCSNCCGELAGG